MTASRVSDLRFAQSRHRYTDPRTGERPPYSVTGIVSTYAEPGKIDRMVGAAVKIGPDYRKVWYAKAEIGKRLHVHAADWAQGKAVDVLETDSPYLEALAQFDRDHHPTWLEVERDVISSLGYGGRFDAVAEFDGSFVLVDFKTGREWTTDLTLQLAAYSHADGMIWYDGDGKAVDLEPLPHLDACAGLYLRDDGSYKLVPVDVEAGEAAWGVFQRLLAIRQWADQFNGKGR